MSSQDTKCVMYKNYTINNNNNLIVGLCILSRVYHQYFD
jgi:hypothetical protein